MVYRCWFSAVVLVILASVPSGSAVCYFPAEYQGEFVTQSTSTASGNGGPPRVQYNQVSVMAESIPVWGSCHRRIGNKVLLMDMTGSTNCVRCFQLQLLSRNVLQVHTEGLDKCYTKEEAALATCPTEESIAVGRFQQILLFKTKGFSEEETITQEYCPLNGRFRFTYNVNDGTESSTECPQPVSEISNCPYGFGLSVRFRGCTFHDHDLSFQCLGDWPGPNNQRYLALLDTQAGSESEQRPRYRCALYREEVGTGRIYLAFSSDSTCQNQLRSANDGYEMLQLMAVAAPSLPREVQSSPCRFPEWAQGHWEHLYVDGSNLVYRDLRNFKTYTGRCIGPNHGSSEHFPVYMRTQCGDEFYNCIRMNERGINVLEFQLGVIPTNNYNESLCRDQRQFINRNWITQGRRDIFQESPCPIAGEYTGIIPDADGLCAKLSSDCNNPEIMFYSVSNCYDRTEVYEGKVQYPPSVPTLPPAGYFRQPRRRIRRNPSSTIAPKIVVEKNEPTMYDPFVYNGYRAGSRSLPSPVSTPSTSTTTTTESTTETRDPIMESESSQIHQNTSVQTNTSEPVSYDPYDFNGYPSRGYYPPHQRWTSSYDTRYSYPDYEYRPPAPMYDSSSDSPVPSTPYPRLDPRTDRIRPYEAGFVPSSPSSVMPTHFQRTTTYRLSSTSPLHSSLPPLDQPPASPPRQPSSFFRVRQPSLPQPTTLPPRRQSFRKPDTTTTPPPTPPLLYPKFSHQRAPHPDEENRLDDKREYRCLGQWEENGVTYTYTQRRDVFGYECFVGSVVNDGEIYIKEAGTNCQRGIEPLKFGMKLTRQGTAGSCFVPRPTGPARDGSDPRPNVAPTQWPPRGRLPDRTTKPWQPIRGQTQGHEAKPSSACKPVGLGLVIAIAVVSTSLWW